MKSTLGFGYFLTRSAQTSMSWNFSYTFKVKLDVNSYDFKEFITSTQNIRGDVLVNISNARPRQTGGGMAKSDALLDLLRNSNLRYTLLTDILCAYIKHHWMFFTFSKTHTWSTFLFSSLTKDKVTTNNFPFFF